MFRVPADLPLPIPESVDMDLLTVDLIVTSQSCDLVEGREKIQYVSLSPVWTLSDIEAENSFMASSYGKEMCRRGDVHGHHMLAACKHEDWQREVRVASFREVHSLPIDFLRRFAEKAGGRLRVRPPYREQLAQAFARYYMRVGLPVDIPSFKTDDSEMKAIRKLEALDDEARERVIRTVSG